MYLVRAVASLTGGHKSTVVIASDGAVSDGELFQQLDDLLPPGDQVVYLDDRRFECSGLPLQEVKGLTDGVTIAREPTKPTVQPPSSMLELLVDGGPTAGWTIPIGVGEYVVGRAPTAAIRIPDGSLGRNHAKFTVHPDGRVSIEDLGSQNGTFVEGRRISGPADVALGSLIRCGTTLLSLSPPPAELAQLVQQNGGTTLVHRRQPEGQPSYAERIQLAKEPEPTDPPSLIGDIGTALVYAAISGGLAMFMGSVQMLVFAAMSPIVGLFSAVIRRKASAAKAKRDWESYRSQYDEQVQRLTDLRTGEAIQMRFLNPGPGQISRICAAPSRRLWERRPTDGLSMVVRVGSASVPSVVSTDDDRDPGVVWMVPIVVPLREAGTFGIKGPIDAARASAANVVLQLAALHGPDELKIVALLSDEAAESWECLRWLPHLRTDLDDPSLRIAAGAVQIADLLTNIENHLGEREALLADQPHRDSPMSPEIVVVIDTGQPLNDSKYLSILQRGRDVGIYALIIHPSQLPDGCNGILSISEPSRGRLERLGQIPVEDILLDGVGPSVSTASARSLARLRPAQGGAAEVPRVARLLDLVGLQTPSVEEVSQRWRKSSQESRNSVRGVVGHDGTGPFELVWSQNLANLLVAGSVGMGKSEFLLTVIAGLVAEYGPDDVMFVVIGFKGIQDFTTVAQLPHMLDVVGNLDPRAFERAMRMLTNEVHRRSERLAASGTKDIDAYYASRLNGDAAAQEPMPRLVVIADEFAELKRIAPHRYETLESFTRIGRALGVHVILATQNPEGVVNDQIKGNLPVRVSFKLIGVPLSKEVIGDPAAAMLPMSAKGRAFVATQGSGLVEVQMARVAGKRPGADANDAFLAVYQEALSDTSQPMLSKPQGSVEARADETDLSDLVQTCRAAAEAAGFETASVPWAKPLQTLYKWAPPSESKRESLPRGYAWAGVLEDPDGAVKGNPIHRDHMFNLGDGNICLFGSSGSGRSVALVTHAVSASLSSESVQIYGLDFTNDNGLALLTKLPNCGGIARDQQLCERILSRMRELVDLRKGQFDLAGVANIHEFRSDPAQEAIDDIVLVVDRIDILWAESDGLSGGGGLQSRNADNLLKLLAEGSSVGLTIIATASSSPLRHPLKQHFKHRMYLRLSTSDDYLDVGVRTKDMTEAVIASIPPGRALLPDGTREVQIGVFGGESRGEQATAITHLSAQIPTPDDLLRIRNLPNIIRWSDVVTTPTLASLPIGVDATFDVRALNVELGGWLVVAGPRRSGRTTALVSWGAMLQAAGLKLAAVDPGSLVAAGLDTQPVSTVDLSQPLASQLEGAGALLVDDADRSLFSGSPDLQRAWLEDIVKMGVVVVVATLDSAFANGSGVVLDTARKNSGCRVALRPSDRYVNQGVLGIPTLDAQRLIDDYPVGRGAAIIEGELVSPFHIPT